MKNYASVLLAMTGLVCSAPLAAAIYQGACDASAAVAVDANRFVVGEDEGNVLRVYRRDGSEGKPVFSKDLTALLSTGTKPEADIEGAARIGDRVYWITSHGRNKKGKLRPNRYRLFATDIAQDGNALELDFVGRYDKLVEAMLKPESWSGAGMDTDSVKKVMKLIAKATQVDKEQVKDLAPKKKGLNIEALAVSRDGEQLLIGLRNPQLNSLALIIPLENPSDLVEGKDGSARFGAPIRLDLGGLGVRAMAFADKHDAYLIVAGPAGSDGQFALYRWSGKSGKKPERIQDLDTEPDASPEALVVFPGRSEVQVLFDEGRVEINGQKCKELEPAAKRRFSSQILRLN